MGTATDATHLDCGTQLAEASAPMSVQVYYIPLWDSASGGGGGGDGSGNDTASKSYPGLEQLLLSTAYLPTAPPTVANWTQQVRVCVGVC